MQVNVVLKKNTMFFEFFWVSVHGSQNKIQGCFCCFMDNQQKLILINKKNEPLAEVKHMLFDFI